MFLRASPFYQKRDKKCSTRVRRPLSLGSLFAGDWRWCTAVGSPGSAKYACPRSMLTAGLVRRRRLLRSVPGARPGRHAEPVSPFQTRRPAARSAVGCGPATAGRERPAAQRRRRRRRRKKERSGRRQGRVASRCPPVGDLKTGRLRRLLRIAARRDGGPPGRTRLAGGPATAGRERPAARRRRFLRSLPGAVAGRPAEPVVPFPLAARWAAATRPRAESAHPRGGAVAKVLSTMRPAERRRPCQINIRGRVKLRTFGWHTP